MLEHAPWPLQDISRRQHRLQHHCSALGQNSSSQAMHKHQAHVTTSVLGLLSTVDLPAAVITRLASTAAHPLAARQSGGPTAGRFSRGVRRVSKPPASPGERRSPSPHCRRTVPTRCAAACEPLAGRGPCHERHRRSCILVPTLFHYGESTVVQAGKVPHQELPEVRLPI